MGSGKEKVTQTYKLSTTIRNYHCTAAASELFWVFAEGWIGQESETHRGSAL